MRDLKNFSNSFMSFMVANSHTCIKHVQYRLRVCNTGSGCVVQADASPKYRLRVCSTD